MTFAKIEADGSITHPYRFPDNGILKTDTDHFDLRSKDPKVLAVHGIFEVVETTKPTSGVYVYNESTVEIVDDAPTAVWLPTLRTPNDLRRLNPPPPDKATTTTDMTVVDGAVVWTERDKTTAEVFSVEQQAAPDTTAVLIARLVAADIPALWRQPQGAHDAYLPGAIVLDDKGDRWRNDLGTANVWPVTNLHAKWTNLDFVEPVGVQPWVAWPGFGPLYQRNDIVTHKGQTWTSTTPNNSWEPPTLWTVVP